MQRYVVILLLFLTTISSAMADTTDDLIRDIGKQTFFFKKS